MNITRPLRKFVKEDFTLKTWEDVLPYFEMLLQASFDSLQSFENWLQQKSELDAVLEEDAAWRYIRMSIDTTNKTFAEDYSYFMTEIQPKMAPYEDQLNNKMMDCPFVSDLQQQDAYRIYFRAIQKSIAMYREENVALEAEISELTQEYGAITGAQTIQYQGEEMTMQKAALFLRKQDEAVRKEVFELMAQRRELDQQKLDDLFDALVSKRHQIAINAGYANYRDYKFDALGRFDYTKEDCFNFHESIKKYLVPLSREMHQQQAERLKKDRLKPWDTEVDPLGRESLKPFAEAGELIAGTIRMFDQIDPYYADCIATMQEMKHLDLESKTGKAPGGYNYPLYEIGVPFIFMNAVGSQKDLVTMVHEGGHAVHSFLSRDLKLTGFKSLPSEVAELASMSMELLTMQFWNEFYANPEDLNRARTEQLESILKILPWIAMIDEFQHWIYTNPSHNAAERKAQWEQINASYGTGVVDWSGYEAIKSYSWHRQLHLFEVPFYYIEYGIAQLGAVSIWKNSQQNFKQAVQQYKDALRLGYSKSIPEIYATAGIRFDFSAEYVKTLADFLQEELVQFSTEA